MLIFVLPLLLYFLKVYQSSLVALGLLLAVSFLYPQLQSLPLFEGLLAIPLASFAFIFIPIWTFGLIFIKHLDKKQIFFIVVLPILLSCTIIFIHEEWLSVQVFTNPFFRLIILVGSLGYLTKGFALNKEELKVPVFAVLISMMFAVGSVAFIPVEKINKIVFDESHGTWETVKTSFGPDDFGRSVNYTYSELFQRADIVIGKSLIFDNEKESLPNTDTIFVLKMPTEKLSDEFMLKIVSWVEDGGNLLAIADHTDLYDSTKSLNQLLANNFHFKINSDAVYDYQGMPTRLTSNYGNAIFGRIDSFGREYAWQTGTSVSKIPFNAIELMSYDPSFSEPANYSEPNRFGGFLPSLDKRFLNHSAVLAATHGKGALILVLDSTPWSNFSIFKELNAQLLKGIHWVFEHKKHLNILVLSVYLLLLVTFVLMFYKSYFIYVLFSFCIGLTVSAGFMIGSVSWQSFQFDKDFNLKVASGDHANFEFLNQLIIPGERNYSRILSALGKYELNVISTPPGSGRLDIQESKNWLLIEPNEEQLPSYKNLKDYISDGNNFTVLFSKTQATEEYVIKWLQSMGLFTRVSKGLGVFDGEIGDSKSIDSGRGKILTRNIDIMIEASQFSQLKSFSQNSFFQTFTIRPTTFPRKSGFLSLGFSSEQFSDDAIGDVWEGINPSEIGRHRERLLASILLGKEVSSFFPTNLKNPTIRKFNNELTSFLVIKNGRKEMIGKFSNKPFKSNTEKYFLSLGNQAFNFIRQECLKEDLLNGVNSCTQRMLSEEMIEWMVKYKITEGELVAVELLHERQQSGLNATWNIIFAK